MKAIIGKVYIGIAALMLFTAGVAAFMTSAALELKQMKVFLGSAPLAIVIVIAFELSKAGLSALVAHIEHKDDQRINFKMLVLINVTRLVLFFVSAFCSLVMVGSQLYDTEDARKKAVVMVKAKYKNSEEVLTPITKRMAVVQTNMDQERKTGIGKRYKALETELKTLQARYAQEKKALALAQAKELDMVAKQNMRNHPTSKNPDFAAVTEALSALSGQKIPYDGFVMMIALLIAIALELVIALTFGFLSLVVAEPKKA